LREIAHLRPRTNTIGAVARVRNALAYATHRFYQERDFLYLHTPMITTSDAEGSGEMFQVTTLPLEAPPRDAEDAVDYNEDFFARQAFLTVSGQLEAEAYALALDRVYTFGPTFRAENSNTRRHLAEFWMIEPEAAFFDLDDNAQLAEDYLKYMVRYVLETCEEDIAFFNKWIDETVLDTLTAAVERPFERITYSEAIEILEKADAGFEYPTSWGSDLQSEHEVYLAEQAFTRRREPARGTPRRTGSQHRAPRPRSGDLLVVPGSATLRYRTPLGIRPRVRPDGRLRYRYAECPGRDPLPAHPPQRRFLGDC